METRIPFLRPSPPRLSNLSNELAAIEGAGIYTNYGPVNTRFERAAVDRMFGGVGGCLTTNNATIALMLAIREAAREDQPAARRFALMPSFTFAATAHAAIWAGLVPLLCDIDPETWTPCAESEQEMLRRYPGQISVVVPCATFGNDIDLKRYSCLAQQHDVGIVVDAAASLGSLDEAGRGFGEGFPNAVVYSMHATKTFATAEAGLIYSSDIERLTRLRTMGNFGFGAPRTATMPGLNSKLSEIGALLALAKLDGFEEVVAHRETLVETYGRKLPGWRFQRVVGRRIAYQFMPVLMPPTRAEDRSDVLRRLANAGVGAAHYFSPHLAEQPYFRRTCEIGRLPVTDRIAPRILSLPLSDSMTAEDVSLVCEAIVREA